MNGCGRNSIHKGVAMRLKLLVAAGALLCACGSQAEPPSPTPSGPPKLLVVISVDQFSANLFDEYRPQFVAGLARLATGTVFHNGYQSHAATETCPGHSTILTGDHPARTGIIGNTWIDQSLGRSDKSIYCAEDESVPGTSSTAYKVSPKNLLVPTLGELMKRKWPASRTVAVSGKDRAAVMMSGQRPDQRWYWTGKQYDTDLTGLALPTVVARVNALAAAGLATERGPMEPTPFCQGKAREIPITGGGKPVGAGRLARKAGDQAGFRASPEFDGDTLALAAALVDEMQLGRRAGPDLLAISLSATDYVGHAYGTEGEEMCLQLTELDREIGDFLKMLDSRGISYSVTLTADHGGKDVPERERLAGIADAARVDPALNASAMGKKLVADLKLPGGPGLLGEGSAGDMYIDRRLRAPERDRLLKAAVAAYRAHPQVETVFTARQIAATPVPRTPPETWTLIQRARASYYPGRSGDFLVILKRDVTPIADTTHYVATHGSVWDYDRRVPILFWRPGAQGRTVEHSAETTDILPTLASTIGLPVQAGSVDGHCLNDVPGAACPAR
jgi:predicted AlkP superfamily pyrophosphatase or phosphodiesterase